MSRYKLTQEAKDAILSWIENKLSVDQELNFLFLTSNADVNPKTGNSNLYVGARLLQKLSDEESTFVIEKEKIKNDSKNFVTLSEFDKTL